MTTLLSSSTVALDGQTQTRAWCGRVAMVSLVLGCAGALQFLEDYIGEEHYVILAFCAVAYYALQNQGKLLKKKKVVPKFEEGGRKGSRSPREAEKPKLAAKKPATGTAAPSRKGQEPGRADLAAKWRAEDERGDSGESGSSSQEEDEGKSESQLISKENIRIRDAARAGNMEAAAKILNAMHTQKRVKPDIVSYNSLISGHAQNGELRQAESWFQKLTEAGLTPDIYSYAPLVRGYYRRGQASEKLSSDGETGEAWLRKMQEAGVTGGEVSLFNLALEHRARSCGANTAKVDLLLFQMLEDGPEPDTASFNIAMKAWAKSSGLGAEGCLERVEAWFKRMQARNVPADYHSYQSLITAYGKAGKVEKAEEALKKMSEQGVPPHTSCYGAMAQVYADRKELDKLWDLLDSMKRRGVKASLASYIALLRPLSAAQDSAGVEKVLTAMKDDGLNPITEPGVLQLRIGAFSGKGKTEAMTVCRMLEEAVNSGAQADRAVLAAVEKVAGANETERMVRKLNLRNHGWKPREWGLGSGGGSASGVSLKGFGAKKSSIPAPAVEKKPIVLPPWLLAQREEERKASQPPPGL